MKIYLTALFLGLFIVSCSVKQTVKEGDEMDIIIQTNVKDYPVAVKKRVTEQFQGVQLSDDYAWIRTSGKNSSEVKAYLSEERKYAEKKLSKLSAAENKIFTEIISKIDQSDVSVPVKKDDYYYYHRDVEGEEYTVYCRKYQNMDAKEEILLDLNRISEEHDYLDLGVFSVSPDHKFLAYSIDTTGDEKYTLYIKYISRLSHFPETFENVDDLEWAESDNAFFYTTVDDKNRTNKIYRHILGTDANDDRLMFEEKDESYYIWIEKSRSRKYLFLGSANKNTSEMHYLKSDEPMGFFELVMPRKKGVEYYLDHKDDLFYILTNDNGAINYKIMTVSEDLPVYASWKELLPERSGIYIDDFDVFDTFIAVSEIGNGKRGIRLIDFETLENREISFTEACHTVYPGSNPMFESRKFRYVYESLTTPYSIAEYDVETGEKTVLKQQKILGDFDQELYRSDLVYASAPDGKKVPVSLVYRTDMFRKDGTNPLLLEAYGAYGDFNDPSFSVSRLSLLDRGFVYALAHVRGGLEKGKKWHLDGMLLNKKNTFTDFIACSEYLISAGYTSTEKLIITGGSAGGMLIGTVLNMRPELFKAAVLDVPFVDVLNTMLDPGLAATVTEYDEWGDPRDKKYFDYIRSYCPYQNIKSQDYPDVLVIAGMNDPRVSYWEPVKWTAKLREYNTAQTEAVLHMSSTGHGGSSGRYDYYKDVAKKFAYIVYKSGIKQEQ